MKSYFLKSALTVLHVVLAATLLSAQGSFDVVSVKPNVSGDAPSDPGISPGRFSWTNVTLRQLIQVAYDKRPHQLIGLPEWVDSAHFDVVATTSGNTSPQQMDMMLQTVLSERFNLTVHSGIRELPVYALVTARRDGKLGPRIQPAAVDCQAVGAKPLGAAAAQDEHAACLPQMGLTRIRKNASSCASEPGNLQSRRQGLILDCNNSKRFTHDPGSTI